MNPIACVTANYVARQLGYQMTAGWGQGQAATEEFFRPVATFGERFGALLAEIRALGFTVIDLWLAHLHPAWATPEQIAQASQLLQLHGLTVSSLAGGFGSSLAEFAASCRLAQALGAPLLGGMAPVLAHDRAGTLQLLRSHGLRLGIENHPEKTPAELRAQIGSDSAGLIGATVDTGWFGTHGYDAALALHELRDVLLGIHLKDVRAVGGHETCRYGTGVVPLRACVEVLCADGYGGVISVEHEPERHDPSEDIRASHALLRQWLSEHAATRRTA